MTLTIVEQVVAKYVEDHPEWAELAAKTRKLMREGYYPSDYLDAICQAHFSVEETVAFLKVHGLLIGGYLLVNKVRVGHKPHSDSHVAENNALLQNLPFPFEAYFEPETGYSAHSDGLFTITEAVQMNRCIQLPDEWQLGILEPCEMPLEVGSTNASRTWLHLIEDRGVARWAYGSEWIWLFAFDWKKAHQELGMYSLFDNILYDK